MGSHTQTVPVPRLSPANGKELAKRILLETMAAIDVRHAMLERIKVQGDVLVA